MLVVGWEGRAQQASQPAKRGFARLPDPWAFAITHHPRRVGKFGEGDLSPCGTAGAKPSQPTPSTWQGGSTGTYGGGTPGLLALAGAGEIAIVVAQAGTDAVVSPGVDGGAACLHAHTYLRSGGV